MSLYGGIELVGKPDLEQIRRLDLLPMPMIAKMQRYGMGLDVEWMADLTDRLTAEMKELRYEICSYIPAEKLDLFVGRSGTAAVNEDGLPMNVDSRPQLATLLFDVLGVGEGRSLKTTKSGSRISTGKKQLEQLKKWPVVVPCLKYAEFTKLRGTYTAPMPKRAKRHVVPGCWCGIPHPVESTRLHCEILTTRADNGRLASKNPNLQNIPVKSAWGREVRKGFIAPEGTELVSVDFSQIELRVIAHLGNVARLIQIFNEDKDAHTQTAVWAFDLTDESQVDKHQRYAAKHVNFEVAYGETAQGLLEQMLLNYTMANMPVPDDLTLEWCEGFLAKWFGIYPEVRTYMDAQYYRAQRYGIVWTPMGRVRRVPEVRSVHRRIVAAGLRQAGNTPISGTAADLIKLAMAEIEPLLEEVRASGVWVWPLMQVHDELLFEVEQGYGDMIKELVIDRMEAVTMDRESGENQFRVPVKADGQCMVRWEK